VVQNFIYNGLSSATGNGILIAPTSGTMSFVISNTVVSNNGAVGIFYSPPSGAPSANGVIDHVIATNNTLGIVVDTANNSGGSTLVAISNSIASNNGVGISANGGSGSLTVSIDNAGVGANSADGIVAQFAATVLLGRSVITGNGTGVQNSTSPIAFYTYQDNRINGNTTNVAGSALLPETLQ
jgi:hypothetical protein